jgi:hypothetical protein
MIVLGHSGLLHCCADGLWGRNAAAAHLSPHDVGYKQMPHQALYGIPLIVAAICQICQTYNQLIFHHIKK